MTFQTPSNLEDVALTRNDRIIIARSAGGTELHFNLKVGGNFEEWLEYVDQCFSDYTLYRREVKDTMLKCN